MYNGQQTKSNSDISFNREELARYNRHLIIPEFGMEGQQKLKSAKVLVVGTGGLGSPLLQYLAAAGVGTIGIVDFDKVEKSNLHRQVLFGISDVGKPKVEAAKEKLVEINPHIEIITHNIRLTSENAMDVIKDYDIVADGTDNFPTRYLVNDACVFLDKPNVYASIFQFEGQVSVFNYVDADDSRGPNYRDLFPTPPPPGLVPSCAEAGVLGVLPGIIGSIQANEVIKVITDIGDPLAGRLFLFDALSFITRTVKIKSRDDNPLTGKNPTQTELIDYDIFCGMPQGEDENADVDEITVEEFQKKLDTGEDIQIIDVREPYEYEIANIGGKLIPLNSVLEHHEEIARDKPVVVHCKGGVRSANAIRQLQDKYGFDNLLNLKGGIIAYSKVIDESVPQY